MKDAHRSAAKYNLNSMWWHEIITMLGADHELATLEKPSTVGRGPSTPLLNS